MLSSLLLSSELSARTVYITDAFTAPLRTGQTNAYRIRANLESGSALELLETNSESGYSKVKTAGGTEGWVLHRYRVNTLVASERLEQNQALTLANTRLEEQLNYIKQLSGNAITINQRNQQLIVENQHLKNKTQLLTADNDRL